MRNILLWDKIMSQLEAGEFGPAPTYKVDPVETAIAVGETFAQAEMPMGIYSDPFLDLNVSWIELEHNLVLMAEDGLIRADFNSKSVANVQLTDKGRRLFAVRNEGERLSSPVNSFVRKANLEIPKLVFPVFAIGAVIWMGLGLL